MAPPAAKNDAAATTQKQLLALVQSKGNAEAALHLLLRASVAEDLPSRSSAVEKATALLRFSVSHRHALRVSTGDAAAAKRDGKKSTKESDKQWALVAAKVAQSVIKLYLGAATAAASDDATDLDCALDLATLALSVSCQLEALVKLSDLVLENMLYQVAKKLGEMPQRTESALLIFAAINLRLWHHHGVLCTQLNQPKSKADSPLAKRVDQLLLSTSSANTPLQLDELVDLCSFPKPQRFHSLQVTRFVISIVNVAVNMLLPTGKHAVILQLATMVEPWINHLSQIPGVDAKLPVSFSDRLFRVLWKCAAAVDAEKPNAGPDDKHDASLDYRSVALSYMLKCPSYSNVYYVQQVHRVGVQYEKKHSTGDATAMNQLCDFYLRSTNVLFQLRKMKTSSIEWDYLLWLEHFVSICDAQKSPRRDLDALTVLHVAIDHLKNVPNAVSPLAVACFQAVGGCIILERHLLSTSVGSISEKEVSKTFEGDELHSGVKPSDRETIIAALCPSKGHRLTTSWIEPVTGYLNGLSAARDIMKTGVSASSDGLTNFILRSIRKVSTRLFNVVISSKTCPSPVADLILSCMVCSGDLLMFMREAEPAVLAPTLKVPFLAAEGRVRRLTVTIAMNQTLSSADEESADHIDAMGASIARFQRVLNEAITDTAGRNQSLPALLGDLQAIAREAYSCATHFYKKNHHSMVVKSLEAAFALAEDYLEQILCDEEMCKNPEQVAAAHRSLKLDAIASLLAYSLDQTGCRSHARQCYGHAILYVSDLGSVSSSGAIGKYVNALMQEFESQWCDEREPSAVAIVTSLCKSVALAWKARGVDGGRVQSVVRVLRSEFERFASRTLDRLRVSTDSGDVSSTEVRNVACATIGACGGIETALWQHMCDGDGDVASPMTVVSKALAMRKSSFGDYYARRNVVEAVTVLHSALDKIATTIDELTRRHSKQPIDLGGCYGWRGVLALEICQMTRYAAARNEELPKDLMVEEAKALDDIKECLSRWQSATFDPTERCSAVFFDARAAAICLDAISHGLSLMSHTELEVQARSVLCRVKSTPIGGYEDSDFVTSVPSLMLQPEHVSYDSTRHFDEVKTQDTEDDVPRMLRLQVIDAEIGLCLTAATTGDSAQAYGHHSEAAKMMQDFRAEVKISSDNSHLYSAVAMRELALSMAASEIKFQEGDLVQAIREAKSALSICWKISKKVGISENENNGFELPIAVTAALGKHAEQSRKTSQLIYFQAMECWSWDVLLAAKLILSRIASFYALTNQPYRSSIYYAEAMTLVGSVVPATTRNRPFFEFAQLQILAERTSHASAVHQLITVDAASLTSDPVGSSVGLDVSVLTQHCEVRLQRGDLFMLEGDTTQAKLCYESALQFLDTIDRRTPAVSSAACGCYRRMVKLHIQTPVCEDTIDEVLRLLKGLKRAIKRCSDIIEYALGTCQLVQASLLLLRSTLSKAFLPAEKLRAVVDEVYTRCDHLGIPHLRQEIRLTAGYVYLMLSESSPITLEERNRMSRVTASLLSSYNVTRSPVQLGQEQTDTPGSPHCIADGIATVDATTLPQSWLIASLTVGGLSQLSISLTPGDGSEPVSFWIGNLKWKECMDELRSIIEASRVTLFGNKADEAEEWTADKKKTWWDTRKDLDNQLAGLVAKMQKSLGFWRVLLSHLPSIQSVNVAAISDVSSLLFDGKATLKFRSQWLLSAAIASNAFLSGDELLQCIDHIAIEENMRIDSSKARQVAEIVRKSVTSKSGSTVSTILIVHHELEQFPWEGLDVLRERAVTRMPSIDLILQNANKIKSSSTIHSSKRNDARASVSPDRVAYLLNPGGDLKTTQASLEPIFKRGEAERGWRGLSGSIPEEETVRDYLLESDLFVYCGHGSGEKYFHRDKIEALQDQHCAAALLFGCSSGRLEREGIFGPNGAVLSYLQAGSPAVLAMLWDVTDKDVDLVSKEILETWLLAAKNDSVESPEALSVALQRSRRRCKLQNLNGLAAVCYGLPLYVASSEPRDEAPESKRRRTR